MLLPQSKLPPSQIAFSHSEEEKKNGRLDTGICLPVGGGAVLIGRTEEVTGIKIVCTILKI